MGTETFAYVVARMFKRAYEVKLNNPLMGTETELSKELTTVFCKWES